MNLLLDQGLPRSAAELLRAAGLEAAHVGELGLSHASDSEILEVSRRRGAVVVTLDADFHASSRMAAQQRHLSYGCACRDTVANNLPHCYFDCLRTVVPSSNGVPW